MGGTLNLYATFLQGCLSRGDIPKMDLSPRAGKNPGVHLCLKLMSGEWMSCNSWYCGYRGDQNKTKNLAPSFCGLLVKLGQSVWYSIKPYSGVLPAG